MQGQTSLSPMLKILKARPFEKQTEAHDKETKMSKYPQKVCQGPTDCGNSTNISKPCYELLNALAIAEDKLFQPELL